MAALMKTLTAFTKVQKYVLTASHTTAFAR